MVLVRIAVAILILICHTRRPAGNRLATFEALILTLCSSYSLPLAGHSVLRISDSVFYLCIMLMFILSIFEGSYNSSVG